MSIDNILYSPVTDHVMDLRDALRGIRENPVQHGYRFLYTHYDSEYRFAYELGGYFFGCPDQDFGHDLDCICSAITEDAMVTNVKAGRNLFDGSEDASAVRFCLGGEGC